MNEKSKTITFVVTALLLGIAAFAAHTSTQPKPVAGFEKVGEPFFPEFKDATLARSIEVAAREPGKNLVRRFAVKFEDGAWRIPSHHNYPAEAAERLARTASSLIGLNRESVIDRNENAQKKYNVLDPTDSKAKSAFTGQRITLRDSDNEILADYIIGKPAGHIHVDDGTMQRDLNVADEFYCVRVPGEKETYKTRVQIDLSTKFGDWIEKDLLKLTKEDLNSLQIDNYELNQVTKMTERGPIRTNNKKILGQLNLTRGPMGGMWELDGMNSQSEQLDFEKIDQLTTLLDEMELVGVRPKLKVQGELLVKSDLTMNREFAEKDPTLFQQALYTLQKELEEKGFTIGATDVDPDTVALMASRGELQATTKTGVRYTLFFGRAVSGDEAEIEIGAAIAKTVGDGTEESTEEETGATELAEQQDLLQKSIEKAEAANESRNRFVAIRVDFDPKALGPVPTAPKEPKAPKTPDGFEEWSVEYQKKLRDRNSDSSSSDEDQKAEKEEDQESSDGPPKPPQDIVDANEGVYLKYVTDMIAHEAAVASFMTATEAYESKMSSRKELEGQGRKIVEELNERFAEWYYVVSADYLSSIKLSGDDLVMPREPSGEQGIEMADPKIELPQRPNIQPPIDSKEAADEESDADNSGDNGAEQESDQ